VAASLLPGAAGEAGAGHAFAQAAFVEEILFEFDFGFLGRAETWLPSAIFLFPLRAACTIWS
jgi:hypothetical protein